MTEDQKHYTSLLLNCYVKTKQKDKIEELIQKSSSDPIQEAEEENPVTMDIETAIDMFR